MKCVSPVVNNNLITVLIASNLTSYRKFSVRQTDSFKIKVTVSTSLRINANILIMTTTFLLVKGLEGR